MKQGIEEKYHNIIPNVTHNMVGVLGIVPGVKVGDIQDVNSSFWGKSVRVIRAKRDTANRKMYSYDGSY